MSTDQSNPVAAAPAEVETETEIVEPVLTRRSPEQRRNIAYRHIKQALKKAEDSEYMSDMSRTEIEISLDLIDHEWNSFVQSHYELSELATTTDAEKVNADFFGKVAGIYAKIKSLLRDKLESLNSNTNQNTNGDSNVNNDSIHVIDNTHENSNTNSNAHENSNENSHVHENSNANSRAHANSNANAPSASIEPKLNSNSEIHHNSNVNQPLNIKLEPIRIPTFNGAKENWVLFRDQFICLVHENGQMNDAVKMNQLFTHLTDKALRVIKGITPAGTNYQRAWKVLNDRFNNDRVLINHHLKRFFNLPTLTKDDPSKLTILVDGVNELINSLPGLNEQMKTWDSILIFCVFNKLDRATQEGWKVHMKFNEKPNLIDFMDFLDQRAQTNDTANSSLLQGNYVKNDAKKNSKRAVFHISANSSNSKSSNCTVCKENHPLYRCTKFRALAVKDRWTKARAASICFKCLGAHSAKETCSFDKCPVCSKTHNRLLCFEDEKKRAERDSQSNIESQIQQANVNHVTFTENVAALLGTAEVRVLHSINDANSLRCLCDPGSQLNLITEDAVKRLGLAKSRAKIQLNGVGGKVSDFSKGMVTLEISSIYTAKNSIEAIFFIVKKITMPLPVVSFQPNWLDKETSKQLADPNFHISAPIDALLGVNIWASILKPKIKNFYNNMIGQKTRFGWVVFGSAPNSSYRKNARKSFLTAVLTEEPVDDILNSITKFWESEEPPKRKFLTAEECECERIFIDTHYRTPNGRYGVQLPFNKKIDQLGRSREIATRQFLALEKRLAQKPEIKQKYIEFMREYLQMGHMTLSDDSDDGYYTPHHCVFSSNKFRTVFNASCTTDTGISLNDAQLVGEKLQADLAVLLLLFRRHRVALTADVKKMYRQIEVHPNHRKFQKILWRESTSDELLAYELNTITYGQAAAPYCAVRALQQCAYDHENEFPLGSVQTLSSFYMDDFLSGGDTIDEALEIKAELEELLLKGGFELAKWCSNEWSVLVQMNSTDEDGIRNGIDCNDSKMQSVLGLRWLPMEDNFMFDFKPVEPKESWTKRQIMSEIGRLYDPNGFVAPLTMTAKLIVQKIWLAGGGWDEPVPNEINEAWKEFISFMPQLKSIRIPRWLGMSKPLKSQLHGCCDASEKAYSAAVYVRTINEDGGYDVHLVQAKTRVAPLSKPLTIPRLELNGALLLAQLMTNVRDAFGDQIESSYYWCDSQVVLYWINKHPSELKTYVANRVSDIQSLTNVGSWRYIPTDYNPADLATRGFTPFHQDKLLWYGGPHFLQIQENEWPTWSSKPNPLIDGDYEKESKKSIDTVDTIEPMIACVHILTVTEPLTRTRVIGNNTSITNVIETYGTFDKIINVIAWVRRASNLFRTRERQYDQQLTAEEREKALQIAINWEQIKHLSNVLKSIKYGNILYRDRAYRNLSLFINSADGLIRLRGRIRSLNLSEDFRNPILLPTRCTLTQRLMEKAHKITLHGGAQQMLQYVRQRFWIPKGRQMAREVVNACVICKRHSFVGSEQQMAPLPLARTTPGRAFEKCGVDYCGPVHLKPKIGRTNVTLKAYICVFVCLSTRAVHLELVSDLTTEAFLAALRRFVARRGRVKEMVSDNGSNFIGAYNVIQRLKDHLAELSEYPYGPEFNLKWKFNTERASHHGGIFEAAVKSAKRHLIRTIGDQRLTFEEYSTILTQVEACLNSRPLSKLSDDAQDLETLTPAHFLIGEPINLFPEEGDLTEHPSNRLGRWQLLQQITQNFWKRWNDEYLHSLIQRPKWNQIFRNFQVNDLVIIREDNLPPSRWKLGRIIQVLPGSDGLVRSVILKTATSTLKRPITRLAFLEAHIESDDDAISSDSIP